MEARLLGGRYELTRRLGAGGMAEVCLAVDRTLGREVAVKVLHPAYAADPAFVERFRREARAVAALNHPHIVSVYDWGVEGDTYYMVMEYVAGHNLKEVLQARGPLPEADVLAIGEQIAAALEAAHRRGVVHRDVKPHNVLLDANDQVKVADFGIARTGGMVPLTAASAVLGTAHYISPEQAQSHPVDGRSDVYSLGVVLYELLAGHVPFQGDVPVAVAWQHIHKPPPPLPARQPPLAPATETAVSTALAKYPEARFPSAEAMRLALSAARQDTARLDVARLDVAGPAPVVSPPPHAGTGDPGDPMTPRLHPVGATTIVVPPPVESTRVEPIRVESTRVEPPPVEPSRVERSPVERPPAGLPTGRTAAAPPAKARRRAWPAPLLGALLALGAAGAVAAGGLAGWLRAGAPPWLAAPPAPVATAPAAAPTAIAPAQPTARPPAATPPPATPVPAPTVQPTVAPTAQPTAAPTAQPTAAPTATAAAVPESGEPVEAVRAFYGLVGERRFAGAAELWSPRMRQAFPPAANIDGRFAQTLELRLQRVDVVTVNPGQGQATVAVELVEVIGNPPVQQRWTGTWQLIRGETGWLLDRPNLTQA